MYNFPPLVFIEGDKGADGFFIDILEYIAEEEGWDLEYIPGSWSECLDRLRNNEIDLLGSIAFSPERDTFLDFTKEFLFLDWGQVFIPPGSNIKTIFDLEGKKVSVLKDSIYTEGFINALNQFGISVELLEVEEYTDIFESVQKDLSDAGITTNIYGSILENNYKIERSDIVFSPVKIRFAVPQDEHQQLVQTLDEYIVKIKSDKGSIYYSLYNKWMHFAQDTKKIPKFIMNVIYAVVLLALIFIVFIFILRQQVKTKTRDLHENTLKLIQSEKRLRLEKEQLPSAYVEWSLDYYITGWNPAAESIFGYSKDEALGTALGEMIPAYEVDHIRNLFKDIVNHRNSRKNINKNITKDGKIITCEWYNKSLIDTDGTPIGIVSIGNDITDKILMEEKMEEANRVKDNFLANVSHELRTPLNGAIGMIELLRNLEQTEESSYYLDFASQSVDRLFSIVKDLLDFVQIDSGKLGLIVESFDFDKLIGHAIGSFKSRLKEKDLSILSRNQGNDKVFTGDKARTAQIIISLLSNAVKFSKKGTISISYSIDPDLNISIADEGIGIAEEEIDDIFNTLEQLEDPYTKQYDGLGLGLAIVKNLTDLMEGKLTVKSELGKGTVFHITIPASKVVSKQTDIKEKSDRKSTVSQEDFHILIAEDEGINRIFIREILKKNKFPVIEAKNGKEVLDLVKTQSPQLILMDIGMPVLSGLDATIELRKMEEFKKIPILALTAYTGKDDITRFLSAGFNEVLAKPINENNLIKKIKEYSC